jgi:formate dehydrogenase iron-sulfur subunit
VAPQAASCEPWNEARALALIGERAALEGALLPILHAINDAFGHVPDEAVPLIAKALNLSRAEVHGVLSFYHDFRRAPAAQHVIKLCRAEACQARGARELEAHACRKLGAEMGGTSTNGVYSLEPVYCLGNCATGPSLLADGELHSLVDAEHFDALLGDLRLPAAPLVRPVAAPARGVTVCVPRDATARSFGADLVADAIAQEAHQRGLDLSIKRTGSRGAFFLEPLVEVDLPGGRVAYAGIREEDVPGLFDAGFLRGGSHAKCIDDPAMHPFFAVQKRLTFARCGEIDPCSIEDYVATGGLRGLRRALTMSGEQIVAQIETSGLRGRGGAGFPAGRKWRTVMETPAERKYIVCNADEGDSGTFADRLLMEGDPLLLIEGMAIAGLAVGAQKGFVYLRSEYPNAAAIFAEALQAVRDGGIIGNDILGSGRGFDIELRIGAGAYICGEETSLLDSLEGKRGQVRFKPPLPAIAGLFGQPTLIHNVLTLAAAPDILAEGGAAYAAMGTGRSRGTLAVQLGGNIVRGGLIEVPFGISLRQVIEEIGGGTDSGRPIRAVQVGGPLGAYLPASQLDLPLDYEALANADAMLGHGGIVVFDDSVDMAAQARFAFEFCAVESCGKCTPCRIGSMRGAEMIDRMLQGVQPAQTRSLIEELCETMTEGSLCALGGLTPLPVLSALRHFPQDFTAPVRLVS